MAKENPQSTPCMTKVRGRSDGVSEAQKSKVPKTMPVLDSGPRKRLIHRNRPLLQQSCASHLTIGKRSRHRRCLQQLYSTGPKTGIDFRKSTIRGIKGLGRPRFAQKDARLSDASLAKVDRKRLRKSPRQTFVISRAIFICRDTPSWHACGNHFFGDCEGFGWLPPSRICRHSLSRRS